VDLPKTQTVKEISETRIIVTVDKGQLVYLGDDAVNIHDLGNKVRAAMHDPQHEAVFLRCDETVPFGTFATVIDTLRQSGIENVSIVTEPLSARPQTE
jgi:biopolymer transport protein TolR